LALSPSSRADTLSSVARRGAAQQRITHEKHTQSKHYAAHTKTTARELGADDESLARPRPLPQYRACRPIPPGGHHKKPWKQGFPSGVHDRWSLRNAFPLQTLSCTQGHPVLL
jgi:hypothetical protein